MTSSSPQPADGERKHLLRLVDSLSDTYRPVGIAIWLNSSNRILGASPAELMEQGRWDELHAEAERLAGGPRNE